ncbi:IclR family transcriptional regulator [Paraburkholderia caledonica]
MNEQTDAADSANAVQAVIFALRILEHVARQKEAVRVTDLAAHFETTKTRIFRHLRTLVQHGYIVQDEESERYQVGSRLIALGLLVSGNFDIASVSQPAMRVLRDKLNHSVVLGVPAADGVHIIAVVPSTAPIEITVRPGSVLGFNYSAQGKIALAYGDSTWMTETCSSELTLNTPVTIVDPSKLKREIDRVREQGWAVAPNEAVTGLNALAAPIFDANGVLVATVAIVDSVQFLPAQTDLAKAHEVQQCSNAISHKLGFRSRS